MMRLVPCLLAMFVLFHANARCGGSVVYTRIDQDALKDAMQSEQDEDVVTSDMERAPPATNTITTALTTAHVVEEATTVTTTTTTTTTAAPNKNTTQADSFTRFCSCGNAFCSCCRSLRLLFNVTGPGCVRIAYLDNDKVTLSLKYGDFTIVRRTISAKNPKPICLNLPGGFTGFCGRLFGFARDAEDFRVCLRFELRADDDIDAAARATCFKIGPQGVRPTDAIPYNKNKKKGDNNDYDDEDDDDDDDDDDDLFGLGGDATGDYDADEEDDDDVEYDDDDDDDDDDNNPNVDDLRINFEGFLSEEAHHHPNDSSTQLISANITTKGAAAATATTTTTTITSTIMSPPIVAVAENASSLSKESRKQTKIVRTVRKKESDNTIDYAYDMLYGIVNVFN